jgi:hypothetical protein
MLRFLSCLALPVRDFIMSWPLRSFFQKDIPRFHVIWWGTVTFTNAKRM